MKGQTMKDEGFKHILIAILGRTPQIVTETLYALGVQLGVTIEELLILTTAEGKAEAERELLCPHSGQLYRLIRDYPEAFANLQLADTQIHVAKDSFTELPDIRNLDDNEKFVDMLIGLVRERTSEQNAVLHCSLAGGRKTMSVYLALALQFFGRPQDKLYHVLVSPPEFEGNPDFYYPPPKPVMLKTPDGREISTAEARIELAELPYVRLRSKLEYLFGRQALSFAEMVQRAQRELEQFPELPPLVVDTRKRELIIGDQVIYLPPKEFALYWFCAERSNNRPDDIPVTDYEAYFEPVLNEEFYQGETLTRLRELYLTARGGRPPGKISFERTQQLISKMRKRINFFLRGHEMSEYYIISGVGRYAAKKYGIKLDKSKITIV